MNLRSILILIALTLAMAAAVARADDVGELVNWHWQAHEYPTSGGNSYVTYNVYALVRRTNGAYLLFTALGVQALPDIITENATCVDIAENSDGTYTFWGIVVATHPCSYRLPIWANKHLAKWHEYPFSQALCQSMKISDCP